MDASPPAPAAALRRTGVPPADTPGGAAPDGWIVSDPEAIRVPFVTHTAPCPRDAHDGRSARLGGAPSTSTSPGGTPMKKAGRKLSKVAESFVEAIGILGGWNRGRRSRSRR